MEIIAPKTITKKKPKESDLLGFGRRQANWEDMQVAEWQWNGIEMLHKVGFLIIYLKYVDNLFFSYFSNV